MVITIGNDRTGYFILPGRFVRVITYEDRAVEMAEQEPDAPPFGMFLERGVRGWNKR